MEEIEDDDCHIPSMKTSNHSASKPGYFEAKPSFAFSKKAAVEAEQDYDGLEIEYKVVEMEDEEPSSILPNSKEGHFRSFSPFSSHDASGKKVLSNKFYEQEQKYQMREPKRQRIDLKDLYRQSRDP